MSRQSKQIAPETFKGDEGAAKVHGVSNEKPSLPAGYLEFTDLPIFPLTFNPLTLRSFREADDGIDIACFYGNTTGEDANYRGKLPTVEAALAWLADEQGAMVPA